MNETLQEALKELFYSLGGSADAVRNTDDVTVILSEMAKLQLGAAISAKELPAVSGDDDGKVLTVVDGEWDAAALPTTEEDPPANNDPPAEEGT